ncbi:MAG: hypothetical protein AAB834_00645 [Patescibacteria group bacterium]
MELERRMNPITVMEHCVTPEAALPAADSVPGTAYASELAGIEAATREQGILGALALREMRSGPDDDPVADDDDWSGSQ